MQEATGSMKGQTGLQRVMRFLGSSSDLAVEQRLDNLQLIFSIESGKRIQEPPRQASESLRRRDDRVFGSRSITWCDNCSGRVVMLRQRAGLKQTAFIGRPVAPIALSPVESQILFCDLLLSHANSNGLHPPGSSRSRCYRKVVTQSNGRHRRSKTNIT
jgi:hypothetical protein